jgi:thioredoxin 1
LKDVEFKEQVCTSDTPVLVEFSAQWCGASHMLSPIIKDIQKVFNSSLKVVRLDIEAAHSIAESYGIHTAPALLIFNQGTVVDIIHGMISRKELMKRIETAVVQ